jgi:hypothetical protein
MAVGMLAVHQCGLLLIWVASSCGRWQRIGRCPMQTPGWLESFVHVAFTPPLCILGSATSCPVLAGSRNNQRVSAPARGLQFLLYQLLGPQAATPGTLQCNMDSRS